MSLLFLIPARGGSKGIPNKNRKLLNGKPLLFYSIDIARSFVPDDQICVSTDSVEIANLCEAYDLKTPFKRPSKLATDTASMSDVIKHALLWYVSKGKKVKTVVLLQPTSPFRHANQVKQALKMYTGKEDMVLSVKESAANPYYNLMEENAAGYLKKSKQLSPVPVRRQDVPKVYEINGAIYIINVKSLLKKGSIGALTKVKKYVMSENTSLDLDTPTDWDYAEFLFKLNKIK